MIKSRRHPSALATGRRRSLLLGGCLAAIVAVSAAEASHLSREDPPEPIFTQRAFIENNLEGGVEWSRASDAQELELGLEVTWVFFERLQLGAEIPLGVVVPDESATQAGLGDVDFSAKWVFCCQAPNGYTLIAGRVDVSPPTGDRYRGIGGEGSFGFSLDLGYGLTVLESLQDLSVQFQASYFQQIRLNGEQLESARDLGLPETREKSVLWNLALVQPVLNNRLQLAFEVLGTSIVDALDASDQGSSLQLAAGFWIIPFDDDSPLSSLSIGLGGRLPVTSRREDRGGAKFVLELAFD